MIRKNNLAQGGGRAKRAGKSVAAMAAALFGTVLPAASAHAGALGPTERAVLAGFNVCWSAEEGGNLGRLAADAGYAPSPQPTGANFYRDVLGSVLFLAADFGPGADGTPEPACRITVLKPQLDTPYAPKQAILPAAGDLINRIVQESQTLGSGYRVLILRQPHPGRPGRKRTLLRSDQGQRARIIYIEEGARDYEFLYAHGARAVILNPATADLGTDPSGRRDIQAFVNDRWEAAFCDLNPQACITPEQQRQLDQAAAARARDSTSWILPFSGIGATARNGDNRSHQQRLNDRTWWENYHRCGRGKC